MGTHRVASVCIFVVIGLMVARATHASTWEQFTTEDGLISNEVYSLYEAADGSIWVGTSGRGLNQYFNGDIVTWDSGGDWVPDCVVGGMCEDHLGRIWACSYYNGCVYLQDGLWNEGFYWNGDTSSLYGSVAGIKCSVDGQLWAGFWPGIMAYDPISGQGEKVWTIPLGFMGTLRWLFIDDKGYIWFSLMPDFLIRLDQEGNVVNYYPMMCGQVCQSADGTIWLGRCSDTSDPNWFGVGRLEGDQFVSVSPPAGSFPAEPMVPICVTNGGEIVAGTDEQDSCGIFIYDGAQWEYHEAPFSAPGTSYYISTLMADSDDNIWFGTGTGGLGLWALRRGTSQPDVEVEISVNASSYTSGDRMRVLLHLKTQQSQLVDLYVAFQSPDGALLFYPSLESSWSFWGSGLFLPAGLHLENYELFRLTLPDLPAGTYRWYAALTHAGTTDFASNIASCNWQFE